MFRGDRAQWLTSSACSGCPQRLQAMMIVLKVRASGSTPCVSITITHMWVSAKVTRALSNHHSPLVCADFTLPQVQPCTVPRLQRTRGQ